VFSKSVLELLSSIFLHIKLNYTVVAICVLQT